jgi:hypothetical protein
MKHTCNQYKTLATIICATALSACSPQKTQNTTPITYAGPTKYSKGTTTYDFSQIGQPKQFQGSSFNGKIYFHPIEKSERPHTQKVAYVDVGNSVIVNGIKYQPGEIPAKYINQATVFIPKDHPQNTRNDDVLITYTDYESTSSSFLAWISRKYTPAEEKYCKQAFE